MVQHWGLCLVSFLFAVSDATTQDSGSFSLQEFMHDNETFVLPSSFFRKDRGFLYLIRSDIFHPSYRRFDFHLLRPESQEQICTVEFKNKTELFKYFDILRYNSFGFDSVLFLATEFPEESTWAYYREGGYLHMGFVNMSTCETFMATDLLDVHYKVNYRGLIRYPNKVDLILANHSICGDLEFCRVAYNALGKRIGEPVAFTYLGDSIFYGKPVQVESPEKGYLGFTDFPGQIIYVDDRATGGIVFDSTKVLGPYRSSLSLSFENGNITKCFTHGRNYIVCRRYDWMHNKTWNIEITTNFSETASVAVANIARGGFWLAVIHCYEWPRTECNGFAILKVDENHVVVEKKHGSVNMTCPAPKYRFSYGSEIHQTDDKFCMYTFCGGGQDHDIDMYYPNLYNQCIPLDEL